MLIGLYKHGAPVAAVGRSRIWWLTPRLRRLDELDPERHTLGWACRYLQDVQTGRLAGPLRSRDAWRFARQVLIPDEALQASEDDYELAELLNVPLNDIATARAERTAEPPNQELADEPPLHVPAPWLARALIIAGLWLTVMFGIELIAESYGGHRDPGQVNPLLMVTIGLACLALAWARIRLAESRAQRRATRATHGAPRAS